MLRVSVTGFFESLGVVIGCMRELDEGVVGEKWVGEGGGGESDIGSGGQQARELDGERKSGWVDEVDRLERVQGLSEGGVIGG